MIKIDFSGKNVLITGAAGGMGIGITRQYAKSGAKVYMADLNEERLKATAEEFTKEGLTVIPKKIDITNEDEVNQLVDSIAEEDGKIDILCHAAGIIYVKPYVETTVEELRRTLEINVVGLDICCRSVLRHMIPLQAGKIVAICSAASREGKPNIAHYTASKFGAHGLLQSIALSVAEYGINVNGLCPGFVMSDMFYKFYAGQKEKEGRDWSYYEEMTRQGLPMKRFQTGEDIGNAAVFMSSEMSCNITGQLLNVDGAMHLN